MTRVDVERRSNLAMALERPSPLLHKHTAVTARVSPRVVFPTSPPAELYVLDAILYLTPSIYHSGDGSPRGYDAELSLSSITSIATFRERALQAYCFVAEFGETPDVLRWFYSPLEDYDEKKVRVEASVVFAGILRLRAAAMRQRRRLMPEVNGPLIGLEVMGVYLRMHPQGPFCRYDVRGTPGTTSAAAAATHSSSAPPRTGRLHYAQLIDALRAEEEDDDDDATLPAAPPFDWAVYGDDLLDGLRLLFDPSPATSSQTSASASLPGRRSKKPLAMPNSGGAPPPTHPATRHAVRASPAPARPSTAGGRMPLHRVSAVDPVVQPVAGAASHSPPRRLASEVHMHQQHARNTTLRRSNSSAGISRPPQRPSTAGNDRRPR